MTAPHVTPQGSLIAETIADIARTIVNRPQTGESRPVPEDHVRRMILALRPTDPIQALLAGNILLLAELIRDCVAPIPSAANLDPGALRREVLGLTRAFHTALGKLERMQVRAAKAEAKPAPSPPPKSEAAQGSPPREVVEQNLADWLQTRPGARGTGVREWRGAASVCAMNAVTGVVPPPELNPSPRRHDRDVNTKT